MDPEQQKYLDIINRRRANKTERYYLDLQVNERALLDAASRIYAAYVSAGQVSEASHSDQILSRSLHEAVTLAYAIEQQTRDATENQPDLE